MTADPRPARTELPRDLPPNASQEQDTRLQQLLRQAQPAVAPAELEAFNARVMAQWQERHGAGAGRQRKAGASWLALLARHPVWVGAGTGLLAVSALLFGLWLPGPDPVLEELMQPDVLSLMAAGQM